MSVTSWPFRALRSRSSKGRNSSGGAQPDPQLSPSTSPDRMHDEDMDAHGTTGHRSKSKRESVDDNTLDKTKFPHIRQRHDWDCGLTCCQMCLKWVNKPQPFDAITKRCPTKSTWSIDLAYLLHGYGFAVKYFTVTWGADESYKSIDYYKDHLDSDASRVNELFKAAHARGLYVEMRTVAMHDVIATLQRDNCVVVILVDTQVFEQGCAKAWNSVREKRNEKKASQQQQESGSSESLPVERMPHSLPSVAPDKGFVGHYVVLVRFFEGEQHFEVCDPGVKADRRVIDRESLEMARKTHGTDEDILVVDVSPLILARGSQDEAELSGAMGGRLGKTMRGEAGRVAS